MQKNFFVAVFEVTEGSGIRIQDPGSESVSQRHGSSGPDPDPYQNVTDPHPQQCFLLIPFPSSAYKKKLKYTYVGVFFPRRNETCKL
jgi:hypothetical protein